MKSALIITLVAALVSAPAAAYAAPPDTPELAWVLGSDTTEVVPVRPAPARGPAVAPERAARTLSDTAAQRRAEEADVKEECAKHDEAQTDQGWPYSRFDQCFLLTRKEFVLRNLRTGTDVGKIKFSSSLLAHAYDGTRQIDYAFNFDEYSVDLAYPESPEIYNTTVLTVSLGGCGTVNVSCAPAAPAKSDTAAGWALATDRSFAAQVTSDPNVGTGKFKIVHSLMDLHFSLVTANPDVIPFSQSLAFSRGRFDSALGPLGGGKHWGAIMPDYVPTAVFDKSAASEYRFEAKHIDDTLHRPDITFPNFLGKSAPGEGDRPLHRLMDESAKRSNHTASQNICRAVWGPDYANGGLECDEYPFQSTYEGSYVSTQGDTSHWNGSARPIDGGHNGRGGNHLQAFYNQNRILDENIDSGQVGPTDPFRVAVTP